MIMLICVLESSRNGFFGTPFGTPLCKYRYFDTETRNYTDLDVLRQCDNVDSNGKGLGFDIKDITVNTSFGGQFGYLAVEEYVDKIGKLQRLGVVDLHNAKVSVLPIETLIDSCKLFEKSVILNYSFVDSKYLRKKPTAVVMRKSSTEFDITSQDTYDKMLVSEFRSMLKSRGMKLGAVCKSLSTDSFNKQKHLVDEFWFKDSSVLHLTYDENDKKISLNYYGGDLYLITSKTDGKCFDFHASYGLQNMVGVGQVLEMDKDIREDFFKFYDFYKDDLLPSLSYQKGVNNDNKRYIYISSYLKSNLITYNQSKLHNEYLNGKHSSQLTFYSLFELLAFKHNLQYFSNDFRKVLKPCIEILTEALKYESEKIREQGYSKEDIQKAINWCNNSLSTANQVWKKY